MTPFLYRIAHTFYHTYGNRLQRHAFVFPNRRSSIFFRYYLAQVAGRPIFSPPIYTINNLMQELSGMQPADRIDSLFVLYEEYCRLRNNGETFDKFVFRGEMIANDFDDIDKYLVDAGRLFTNIKDLKEIETDYLQPEQIEVISHFWHSFLYPDASSEKKKNFASLWEILHPLYTNYGKRLAEKGVAYEGMMFREVAAHAHDGTLTLPDGIDRFVFIGFNAITEAERALMKHLRDTDRADFYWDTYAPTLQDTENKASYFLRNNSKQFKPRLDIGEQPITSAPHFTVIPVSSGIGQAKQAGKILSDWLRDGTVDPEKAMNTAIVLPDEELLMPMLYSVPEAFRSINITMGYPLKHTPVATLFDAISQMQKHIRHSRGRQLFYHTDVHAILNHPFVQKVVSTLSHDITGDMIHYNRAYVSADDLQQHEFLRLIFRPVATAGEAGRYLQEILAFLLGHGHDEETESDAVNTDRIGREYLYHYSLAVKRLQDVMSAHQTQIDIFTYFALLNKITAGISIPFRGEPLSGLQIMGVLETRALDFDNIIILSMNEGVFPARKVASSLIPYNLRRGFGLATTEHQDSIYAYYFYRMVSRAKNVVMIYDCRTDGLKKGEMSRYVYQLKYHYSRLLGNLAIEEKNLSYNIAIEKPSELSIAKTAGIMAQLNQYLEGGCRNLSASGLNTYLNCPLQFYLQNVEQIAKDEEISESIDSGVFGTIYHGAMRELYDRLQSDGKPTLVTADKITSLLKDSAFIDSRINKWFAIAFFKASPLQAEHPSPLSGQHSIIAHIIKQYVLQTLRTDLQATPFTYIASEMRLSDIPITLGNGKRVMFKAFIDRVDAGDDTVRIVDYKTGNDAVKFDSAAALFDPRTAMRPKAICQVLLYCRLYRESHPDETRKLKPVIYKLKTIFNTGFSPDISYRNAPYESYDDIAAEYDEELDKCLTEMFDPDTPFVQTQVPEHCKYCDFKDICKR